MFYTEIVTVLHKRHNTASVIQIYLQHLFLNILHTESFIHFLLLADTPTLLHFVVSELHRYWIIQVLSTSCYLHQDFCPGDCPSLDPGLLQPLSPRQHIGGGGGSLVMPPPQSVHIYHSMKWAGGATLVPEIVWLFLKTSHRPEWKQKMWLGVPKTTSQS